MMRASEIAESIGSRWPLVLEQLGIAPEYLTNKHGPCPACGGHDRYRFDNKNGRGGFFCNGCGAGDGFTLLQRVHGWDFRTARDRVLEAIGMARGSVPISNGRTTRPAPIRQLGMPSRITRLRRETCRLEDCADAIAYLEHRGLWPTAGSTSLRAHPSVQYFDQGEHVDRYPALIADIRDAAGELVTVHVTYLDRGRKLTEHEPRKILSPLKGRESCAVRLFPLDSETLGIGEGIETCIAASILHRVPTWSVLNTSLLAKFTPPESIKHLIIFGDRDVPGLEAAMRLVERLQGKVKLEIRTPPGASKDWNDELVARGGR